jgi:cyclic pyranopterin monophosphate synthase
MAEATETEHNNEIEDATATTAPSASNGQAMVGMRDISRKISTFRTATAKAVIKVSPNTIALIRQNKTPKIDVLPIARVAAVQAAKKTSDIIPYCHPLPVSYVGVNFHLDEDFIEVEVLVKALYRTGVEMEALTAASVAALTIYDMAKMIDDSMQIESIRLVEKTGGKSSFKHKHGENKQRRAAVFVMSDSIAKGKGEDKSGKLIVERLEKEGLKVVEYQILPDDESLIIPAIRRCTDDLKVDLVITTGGTGVSPRDVTPEALSRLIERPLPGITEAIRSYGQERNPYAMLSRSTAGVRNRSIIVSMPGSSGGVKDSIDAIFPAILHTFNILEGESHK